MSGLTWLESPSPRLGCRRLFRGIRLGLAGALYSNAGLGYPMTIDSVRVRLG